MAITVLLSKTPTENQLTAINVCKSASGVCGSKLRKAHYFLGDALGIQIALDLNNIKRIAIIIMMRAGIPFAMGVADALEDANKTVNIFFSVKDNPVPDIFDPSEYDLVIIADAVIKTGTSMVELENSIGHHNTIFATNVLDQASIMNFNTKTIYAVRTSENSYIGATQKTIYEGKGPDTGDRLYYSDFYCKGGFAQ